jgi:hypothetical protein
VLGAALSLALCPLVRYVGVAWVAAAVLAVLLWPGATRRRRMADAALLAAAGGAPIGLWLLRSGTTATSVTGRHLAFHPPGLGHLEQLRDSASALWGWGEAPAWSVFGLVPLLALGVAARAAFRGRAPALWFPVLACGCYSALLLLSLSFVDADTALDTRILLPAHALAVTLVAALPVVLPRAARMTALLLVFLGAVGALRTIAEADRLGRAGEGFTEAEWRTSDILSGLRVLPRQTRIFTTAPEIVAFFRGGDVADVPTKTDRISLTSRPQYARELRALCAAAERGAMVAYLDGVNWVWEAPSAEEVQGACGLARLRVYEDGSVYGVGGR